MSINVHTGVVGGILGMTMELSIPSIFNVIAGMSILVSALHRIIKMYFSKHGDEQGGTSNHNAPSLGPNIGEDNTQNNRSESDDSSSSEDDDLDTRQDQDATTEDNAEETPPDLPESSLKSIRKIMGNDLKKMKQALQTELKESNEAIKRDLKESIEVVMRYLKNDIALELKESRKATAELKANQRLVIDFTETIASDLNAHKALTENFMKETRSQISELAAALPKRDLGEIKSEDSFEGFETGSCSTSDQVEFTDVHLIDEKPLQIPYNRFQRASNLAVLFTRSTKRTKGAHNHNILTLEDNRDKPLEQVESKDESPAHSNLPIPEEAPSPASVILDHSNDPQDDDFIETIVLP